MPTVWASLSMAAPTTDELAAEMLLDERVDRVVVHLLDLEVVALDLVGVDAGRRCARRRRRR